MSTLFTLIGIIVFFSIVAFGLHTLLKKYDEMKREKTEYEMLKNKYENLLKTLPT